MSTEKDLKIIVSVLKSKSNYQVTEVINDLNQLANQITKIKNSLKTELKFNFQVKSNNLDKVTAGLERLSTALDNLIPSLTPTAAGLNAISSALSSFDPGRLGDMVSVLNQLSAALSKATLKDMKARFEEVQPVLQKVADAIENLAKSYQKLEGYIDSVILKVEKSVAVLSGFADSLKAISASMSLPTGTTTINLKPIEQATSNLSADLRFLEKQIDRNITEFDALSQSSNRTSGDIARQQDLIKLIRGDYRLFSKDLERLIAEYDILSKTQGTSADTLNKTKQSIDSATAKLQVYEKQLEKLTVAEKEQQNQQRQLRDSYNSQFQSISGIIERQVKFIASATLLAGTFSFVNKAFESNFEVQNNIQKILTVSRSNFLDLNDTAELVGKTLTDTSIKTGTSVSEVGSILKELGSAGLTTEQSVAALNSTLNNIIGTDSSVAETTRLVASTFNILGNSVAGTTNQVTTFTRINDIFARSTLESSTELDQLVQGLKFALPAAKEAGLGLEEVTGILSDLADQGLRGGNAGRAFRAVLQQISKDAKNFKSAFSKIGIKIDIDPKKTLDVLDIINQIGDQIRGREIDVEELGVFFTSLGLRGADAFLLLAKDSEKLNKQIKDLKENSQGAAEAAANLRLDTPERQLAIFSQNISQLSRLLFGPFVAGFTVLIKNFNALANSIRTLSDNGFIKFLEFVIPATIALKAFVSVSNLLSETLARQTAVFLLNTAAQEKDLVGTTLNEVAKNTLNKEIGVQIGLLQLLTAENLLNAEAASADATASEALTLAQGTSAKAATVLTNVLGLVGKALKGLFSGLSFSSFLTGIGAVIAVLVVLGTVGKAVYDHYNKSLDDIRANTAKLNEELKEQKKFAQTFTDLASRVDDADKAFQNGTTTYKEYRDELNSIAQLSDEASLIIANSGGEASKASSGFRELANARKGLAEEIAKAKNASDEEEFKKISEDALDAANSFNKANGKLNNLTSDIQDLKQAYNDKAFAESKFKSFFVSDAFGSAESNAYSSIARSLEQSKEEFSGVEKEAAKASGSLQHFRNELIILASKTTGPLSNTIRDFVKEIDRSTGYAASLEDQFTKVRDVLTVSKELAGKLTFESAIFSISQVDKYLKEVNQTITGLEGLSSYLTIEANVVLPDNFADNLKKQVEKETYKGFGSFDKLFDKSNIDAASKAIAGSFKQAGIASEQNTVQAKQFLSTAIDGAGKITDFTERSQYFQEQFLKLTDSVVVKYKEQGHSADEIRTMQDATNVVANEFLSTLQDQNKAFETTNELLKADNKVRATGNAYDEASNKIRKEGQRFTRDILIDDQHRLILTQQQAKEFKRLLVDNKGYAELREKASTGDINAAQKLFEISQLLASKDKEKIAAREKLIQDENRIYRNLLQQQITSKNIERNSGDQIDQLSEQDDLMKFQLKNLNYLLTSENERIKAGLNLKEVQTEILKLDSQSLEIGRKRTQAEVENQRNAEEATFTLKADLVGNKELVLITNKRQEILNEIERNEKLLADYRQRGGSQENAVTKIKIDQVKLQHQLNDNTLQKLDYDRKVFDQALSFRDLQKSIFDDRKKVFEAQGKKVEDPLVASLQKSISENDFEETIKLQKQLGLSFRQTTNLLGDSTKKTELFLVALRQGKIDLSDYNDDIKKQGEAYIIANRVIEDNLQLQEKLNDSKRVLIEKEINDEIATGTLEGKKHAIELLGQLRSISEVLDTNKGSDFFGQTDYPETLKNLDKINDLYDQISKITNENAKGPLDAFPEAVDKSTKALKELKDVLYDIKDVMDNLGVGDFPSFVKEAQILSDLKFSVKATGAEVASANPSSGGMAAMAVGGVVPGSGNGDTVPAMLTPGEFVIPKSVVEKFGLKYFYDLITGQGGTQHFAKGGYVQHFAGGGEVTISSGGTPMGTNYGYQSEDLKELGKIINSAAFAEQDWLEKLRDKLNDINSILNTITRNMEDKIRSPLVTINSTLKDMLDTLKDIGEDTSNTDSYLKILVLGLEEDYRKAHQDTAEKTVTIPPVPGFATGGFMGVVPGSGSGDTFQAMLEPGEYVIKKDAVDKFGVRLFEALNRGFLPKFADGGATGGTSNISDDNIAEYEKELLKVVDLTDKQIENLTEYVTKNEEVNKSLQKSIDLESRRKNQVVVDRATIEHLDKTSKEGKKASDVINGPLTKAYIGYRKAINDASASTDNFLKKFSAQAANRFLDQIDNIQKSFEDLFTTTLPSFLNFFLEDVVLNNALILADYAKRRKDIAETYKNEKADLIEQLKRNEISYIEYFDRLEDLDAKNKKDQIDLDKEKNKALEEQFSKTAGEIGNIVSKLATDISSTLGNALGGFSDLGVSSAASIKGVAGGIGSALGGLGGPIGAIVGAIGSGVGQGIGLIIQAASQFFSFAAQGFTTLIPIVVKLSTLSEEEFNGVIEQLKNIPQEIIDIVFGTALRTGLVKRIPLITDALATSLIPIGNAIGDAIEAVFPQIANAFGKIISTSMLAVVPVIISIFDVLPDFLQGIFNNVLTYGPFIADLFIQAAKDFSDSFIKNLPRLFTEFEDFMTNLIKQITAAFNVDSVFNNLTGAFTTNIGQIVTDLSQGTAGVFDTLKNNILTLGTAVQPDAVKNNLSSIQEALSGSETQHAIQDFVKNFLDTIVGILPSLGDTIGTVISSAIAAIFDLNKFGEQFYTTIISVLSEIAAKIPPLITSFIAAFVNAFPKIATAILDGVQNLLNDILSGSHFDEVLSSFFGADTIGKLFEKLPETLQEKIVEFVNIFVTSFPKIVQAFVNTFTAERLSGIIFTILKVFQKELSTFGPLALGSALGTEEIVSSILSLRKEFEYMINGFIAFVKSLANVVQVFINQGSKAIQIFGNFINKISQLESFKKFQTIVEKIQETFKKIVQASFEKLLEKVFTRVGKIFYRLAEIITRLTEAVLGNERLMFIFEKLLDALADVLIRLDDILGPIIDKFMPELVIAFTILLVIGLIPLLAPLVVLVVLLEGLLAILDLINYVIGALTPIFNDFLDVIDAISPIALQVIEVVTGIVAAFVLLTTGAGPLAGLIFYLVSAIVIFAAILLAPILPLVALIAVIGLVVVAIYLFHDTIFNFVKDFMNLVNDIVTGNTTLIATFTATNSTITDFNQIIQDIGTTFTNVNTILNDAKDTIVQTFQDLVNSLLSALPSGNGSGGNNGGSGGGSGSSGPHFPGAPPPPPPPPSPNHTGAFSSGNPSLYGNRSDIREDNNLDSIRNSNNLRSPTGSSSDINTINDARFGNMNTRQYYLDNFYKNNGNDTSGLPPPDMLNSTSAEHGSIARNNDNTMIYDSSSSGSSGSAQRQNNLDKGGLGSVENSQTSSKTEINITVHVDQKGSVFSTENIAEEVKNNLVKDLTNDNGAFAEKMREITKKGK